MGVEHPLIIQGGMGIGVSNWGLARAVSIGGQLGTVSGTGVWLVMTRRLQLGDPGGHVRRALEHFPIPEIAARILDRYFIPGGKPAGKAYRNAPMLTLPLQKPITELLVAGSFVEVWLAKEGHSGKVAINLLEKIQLSLLPSLYGAMLAGVDYVLMGAGIPLQVAEALDQFAAGEPASYRLQVTNAGVESHSAVFDPGAIPWPGKPPALRRPFFFPIISSHVLGQMLAKRSVGRIDGFVVEGPTAGGHNAPPRNRKELTSTGEPLYTEADEPDLQKLGDLGLPFWLAGSAAGPGALARAQSLGATGIQAGSIFALCQESGFAPDLRFAALGRAVRGELEVFTSPRASTSGFPFKEAQLPYTLAVPEVYEKRQRVCDIGALRELYVDNAGKVGYRCSGEPVDHYVKKGGSVDDTVGRKCLCNALMSTVGLAQVRPATASVEPPLLTMGADLTFLPYVLAGRRDYSAEDALKYLLGSGAAV